jgi:hypothetical protein
MKKYILLLGVLSILITSCSVSKETAMSGDRRSDEATIKQAIESRRFIVKLERLYAPGGQMLFLRPRSNYIIVDGQKAVISTAYVGRQYDIRPIAGINMLGRTSGYELTNKVSKGSYEVKMEVGNGASTFDVFLTISKTGSVSASVNSLRIENTRFFGYIVPIQEPADENRPQNDLI